MQAEVIRFLPTEVRKETDHTCRGPGGACLPGQGQGASALAAGGIIPPPDQGCAKAWGDVQASHAIQNNTL